MAAVDGLQASSGSERAAERSAGASVSRQSWLRELELARWREEQQSRTGGNGERAAEPGVLTSSEDRGASPVLGRRGLDGVMEPLRDRSMAGTSGLPAIESARRVEGPSVGAASRELFAVGNAAYAAPGFRATAPSVLPRNGQLSESAAPASKLLQSTPDWQKQNVHVVAAERNVQVWIRDPQLDRDRGLSLLAKLSASMKSIGKRLIALTINGQSVSGTTPRS